MALSAGTRIGPYEVIAQIGVGGMGEVYRARDTKLGRDVAIKVLPESVAQDADRLARFDREAKALAALNHPGIAAIYGLEESDGTKALVMELIEGPTLGDRIAQGPLPVDEALPIAKQIAEALEAAHEQGIIHRDLKPANIKLRPDGTVKVLDFGLAKAMEPAAGLSPGASMSPTITTPAMTQAGLLLGTPAYMSPEQAKSQFVDRRSDVWAFGCVLAEMLGGRRAFPGDDVSETLASILAREPDLTLPATTPIPVKNLISRCLVKDARRRVRDIGDAMRRLDEDLEGVGSTATAGSSQSPRRDSRLGWLVAISVAVVLVAGAYLAGGSARQPAPPETRRFDVLLGGTVIPNTPVSISPDGQRLAYVGLDTDGQALLMTRRLDEEQATQLRQVEGPYGQPFFSFDGRSIGLANGGRLVRIPVTGGPFTSILDGGVTNHGPAGLWGAAGDILIPIGFTGVSRVSTTDASSTLVQEAGTFLPDGRTMLVGSQVQASAAAASIPLGVGTPRSLRFVPNDPAHPAGYVVYLDDDNVLQAQSFNMGSMTVAGPPVALAERVAMFSASDTGTIIFPRVPEGTGGVTLGWLNDDGSVERIVVQPGNYSWPMLSPDGRQLAFEVQERNERYIAIRDLERDVTRRLSPPGVMARNPQWMPTSDGVLFKTENTVWFMRADGAGAPRRLFDTTGGIESISPDGRTVALTTQSSPERARDIEIVTLSGEGDSLQAGMPQSLVTGAADEINPRFSPDGRWLAYSSSESDAFRIYVLSVAAPEVRWQVSEQQGFIPNWASTANQIYFRDLGGRGGGLYVASYSISGDIFVAGDTRRFAGGATADMPADGARSTYSVAPDGRVVIRLGAGASAGSGADVPYGLILNAGAMLGQVEE